MPSEIRVLFLGDVIGKPGRVAAEKFVKGFSADFTVINGENLAGGIGITPSVAAEMLSCGIDVITTGNHVWKKKEIIPYLMGEQRVLRPLNYPTGTPGFGHSIVSRNGKRLCVVNIEGRIFMNPLACPFRSMERLLEELDNDVPIFVDFHAEATSEKIAMGWYLDGKVGAMVGTHTHVQTADERVLPKGTGYMTDAGMTGATDSVIGMDKKGVLEKFITQLPQRFEVGKNDVEVQGAVITLEAHGNRCVKIERIKEKI
ncbi:TIGR00282 family metallophosphoesterase [Syntrophorhabdus aromaticivorans]|uniref:TIGR00282 family metallophosphoesterase n=1 Tax=Syntrophorhabdus aromaticivorans TaxID=328301 RepID=A0A351U1U6_9BACT|nr:TIGR00282 family metallophosphoesterase [Syntrophorhabdus aromaticivorans]NLW36883.1 TIGR00282 family metallophosphoesterase [Syntrophorhabdus aromaticivorans]HBA53927.1 TIGR00282 family metallophosphoesterase [Syntrophorhabdus aromaticivorans]